MDPRKAPQPPPPLTRYSAKVMIMFGGGVDSCLLSISLMTKDMGREIPLESFAGCGILVWLQGLPVVVLLYTHSEIELLQ